MRRFLFHVKPIRVQREIRGDVHERVRGSFFFRFNLFLDSALVDVENQSIQKSISPSHLIIYSKTEFLLFFFPFIFVLRRADVCCVTLCVAPPQKMMSARHIVASFPFNFLSIMTPFPPFQFMSIITFYKQRKIMEETVDIFALQSAQIPSKNNSLEKKMGKSRVRD
jgi:hypothetical protein